MVVANWVGRALLRVQERRHVDLTLRQFIASTARVLVIGMFVIMALSKLGISITPLIAALGGLAVGASFAIQGPVSNYGAGMVVILTRMFKIGDTINVQDCSGVVADISLSSTRLVAEDGEDIIIPNKHIVGEVLRNSYDKRLVEGRIGIDPEADIPRLRGHRGARGARAHTRAQCADAAGRHRSLRGRHDGDWLSLLGEFTALFRNLVRGQQRHPRGAGSVAHPSRLAASDCQ